MKLRHIALCAALSDEAGAFADRDRYLVVYGLDGTRRAHGANAKQVGRDLIELTDIDGQYCVTERVAMGQAALGALGFAWFTQRGSVVQRGGAVVQQVVQAQGA